MLFHDQTETTDADHSKQREGWAADKGKGPGPRTVGNVLRQRAVAPGSAEHAAMQNAET